MEILWLEVHVESSCRSSVMDISALEWSMHVSSKLTVKLEYGCTIILF